MSIAFLIFFITPFSDFVSVAFETASSVTGEANTVSVMTEFISTETVSKGVGVAPNALKKLFKEVFNLITRKQCL